MKKLYLGGIKSGKSALAEAAILQQAGAVKPYYLATTQCLDAEMRARIAVHLQRRADLFITLEEPLKLHAALEHCTVPVLIECITMWLNNMLYYQISETQILQELAAVMQLPVDLVIVHNEVGLGVIADNPLARQFIDLSGKAAQLMATNCDEVYFCSAGLALRMK